jgi:nucleoside-diphosphate-sugar epimerase
MSRIIALTGATGFIGGALAHRLRIQNWQVRALARPASNRDPLAGTGVHWIEGDLDDQKSLCRLVKNTYAIVHCAGAVRGTTLADFARVNRDGTARLVQAAGRQHPAPRFLLMSSLAAREPHLSPYAASKKQGEEALIEGSGEMQWSVLRPPPVYGPGDKELLPLFRWMSRGLAPVLGSDHARFSLLYIEDLAEAILQWLAHGKIGKELYELHDGQPNGYVWEDLIRMVDRLSGRRAYRVPFPVPVLECLAKLNTIVAPLAGYSPMLTPGKVRELRHLNWVCDNAPFRRETGWTPCVRLEEGLQRTLGLAARSNRAGLLGRMMK